VLKVSFAATPSRFSEEDLMNRHATAIRAVLAIGIAIFGFATSAAAGEAKVGELAPAFTLAGSTGKDYSLADYKGKSAVVLAWFPRAFTGGCTAECKSLRENGQAIRALNVAYFTISTDDAETNRKFAESLSLDYPILSDPGKHVAKAYGVVHQGRTVPERWTFYIDREGVIRAIDKNVKTGQHGADVAAKLKELGIGGK
jgi:peroxiredoxin Q/BCP